jgi:hypothetical protein
MTPLPVISEDQHSAMNHRIYMADFNRKTAHSYLRRPTIYGKDPAQFHWHMHEAIKWIQAEKYNRRRLCTPNS